MTDQPTADAGVDRIAPRGKAFQFDRSRSGTTTAPMRRIVLRFDAGGFTRASPIGLEAVAALVDAGIRPDAPSGEQSILAFEPPATNDQLIDRFLNTLDFGTA